MIAVLTDPAVGGTFVTWSLHYLAGHQEHFVAKTQSWQAVPDFPLTDKNSHNFTANHPLTAQEFDTVFNQLINQATDQFHSIYLHNFIHTSQSLDENLVSKIKKIQQHNNKIVMISGPKHMSLYHAAYQSRSGSATLWQDTSRTSVDNDEIFQDFLQHFFADSLETWKNLQLHNIWDQREFIALNFDFDQAQTIAPNLDPACQHYSINTLELWNTFDHGIKKLFEYLELDISVSRWTNWTHVYQQWRCMHFQRMQFAWYFDAIVDGIITGQALNLSRFDLDLVQEAAIQNRLIRKHNLNLKTWQLERFSNTQQLHNLLETNIHN